MLLNSYSFPTIDSMLLNIDSILHDMNFILLAIYSIFLSIDYM